MPFEGVCLSDLQLRSQNSFAESVLGEGNYALIRDFFASTWQDSAEYKVYLARRCYNLMYLFYRLNYREPDLELQRTFYSDSALLANVPEIAEHYMKTGAFPRILITDDILIHGRALNSLVDKFIDAAYNFARNKGCIRSKNEVERDALKSITIRVIVQSDKPLLIRGKYFQRLECRPDMSDVWPPARWHDLSSRISRLIAESFFSHTSYILTLYQEGESSSFAKDFSKEAEKQGFLLSRRGDRHCRDVWVKPLKNNNGDIMAFYTLRITQNGFDGHYCVIPFVLLPDFCYENGNFLSDRFLRFEPMGKDSRNINDILRSKVEAFNMLISHNILLLLDKNGYVRKSRLDYDKAAINYQKRKNSTEKSVLEAAADMSAPIVGWEDIDNLILNATKNSEPLVKIENMSKTGTDFSTVLEDYFADDSAKTEHSAFLQYNGLEQTSYTAPRPPLKLLVKSCAEKYERKFPSDDKEIANSIGGFLIKTDLGIASIGMNYSHDENGREIFACDYHAGEHSQFIYPKRYSLQLPVLAEIERDCSSMLDEIKTRITRLFPEETADKLNKFVGILYDSGQRIRDWDINFLDWAESGTNTAENSKLRPQGYKVPLNIISSVGEQLRWLEEYRKIYPKKNS